MKKRLISILCAAAMATSLFAGATVVSAAENKEAKDITIGDQCIKSKHGSVCS